MSDDDIEKAVKEAAEYEAQDKKRKEAIDARNDADSMVFQTEQAMSEVGDKLDPADKAKLNEELESFKKVREGNNAAEIKTAMDKFTQTTYDIFGKVYAAQQQAGQQPGAGAGQQGGASGDGHVDADYEVHDN